MEEKKKRQPFEAPQLSDADIMDAMKEMSGFIDITPADFKELYLRAYHHAIDRLLSTKAEEFMSRDVTTVSPDTPLYEVASTMAERGFAGVPVIDRDRKVVGVISEKDFLSHMGEKGVKNLMELVAECLKGKGCLVLPIKKAKASDIMTSPAITIRADAPLVEVLKIFTENKINRLPVVDESSKIVGIITRQDIVQRFSKQVGIRV